ncbi:MAG: helix-turn-helix domain-containing protein [Treponema sp.]|nr:helix-turn-helix domain-containing protein [Treponema sp.]
MNVVVENMEKQFIKRLREEREKAKISQLDLALKAGLSQNLVNFIETGKRVPNLHTVFKLCVALNINPAVLFDEPDEAKENAKQQILALVQHYL